MRFVSPLCVILLWSIGVALAAFDLWAVAARSAIPLAIDDVVIEKEVRREQHPGEHDVHLLRFKSGRRLHVDATVAAAVNVDDRLRKTAWDTTLAVGEAQLRLTWSDDARGMLPTSIIAVALVSLLASLELVGRSRQAVDGSPRQ